MPDWWIWSSKNLEEWKHECTITPEETYAKKTEDCLAVDAAFKNDKYYLFFSEFTNATVVLISDASTGLYRSIMQSTKTILSLPKKENNRETQNHETKSVQFIVV